MLDWNGNGKIDEVDIGISMVMENAAAENKKVQQKKPTGGCFTACLIFIIFTICIIVLYCLL